MRAVACARCGGLHPPGYRHPGRSGSSRPELNSARWKRVTKAVRARDRLCQYRGYGKCAGALQVHHLRKPGGDEALMFSMANLILLCRRHHVMAEKVA
jgi:5-methylcytosine-specific restriction endonuclease McrA